MLSRAWRAIALSVQRTGLEHLDPRTVDEFLPLVERYKRRGYTAAACANAIARPWGRQAAGHMLDGLRPTVLIEQDLRAALNALSDIIHVVYGTRIAFLVNGEVQQ
jgi:hypothetical protein